MVNLMFNMETENLGQKWENERQQVKEGILKILHDMIGEQPRLLSWLPATFNATNEANVEYFMNIYKIKWWKAAKKQTSCFVV